MQSEFCVGDDFVHVHHLNLAQAMALRTSSLGGVEAKAVGLRFRVGDTRCGAHEVSAEVNDVLAVVIGDQDVPFAEAHSRDNALFNALFARILDDKTVNDDFDVVGFIPIQLEAAGDVRPGSVDACAEVSLLGHGLK